VINAFVGVFYYSLGNIFRTFENKKEIIKKRYIYLIISILLLTALAFIAPYTGDISMAYNIYSNEIIFVICSVIGCFALFYLSKFINKSKFFEYYGRNSLIILTLQFPLFKGMNKIICHILNNYYYLSPVIIALTNFAICFIVLNALIPLINKFFPLYAGKIKNEIK
jgi:fucose 4-O-acetylase-like acetyltransferase